MSSHKIYDFSNAQQGKFAGINSIANCQTHPLRARQHIGETTCASTEWRYAWAERGGRGISAEPHASAPLPLARVRRVKLHLGQFSYFRNLIKRVAVRGDYVRRRAGRRISRAQRRLLHSFSYRVLQQRRRRQQRHSCVCALRNARAKRRAPASAFSSRLQGLWRYIGR